MKLWTAFSLVSLAFKEFILQETVEIKKIENLASIADEVKFMTDNSFDW